MMLIKNLYGVAIESCIARPPYFSFDWLTDGEKKAVWLRETSGLPSPLVAMLFTPRTYLLDFMLRGQKYYRFG